MIEQLDKDDIPIDKNSTEFLGLLNENVEALFNASNLAKFRTYLFEYQTDEIGNLNDAILKLMHEGKPEKLNGSKDYTLWFSEKSRSGKAVSPQIATLMMNKDEAVIVDIREKKEYSEGRITGSLHIPYDSLKERSVELKKFDDKQIILVDKMGQHSGMAGKLLQTEGFQNVCRMSGGISEWKSLNLPLVKK